jgi:hypothetical protein
MVLDTTVDCELFLPISGRLWGVEAVAEASRRFDSPPRYATMAKKDGVSLREFSGMSAPARGGLGGRPTIAETNPSNRRV